MVEKSDTGHPPWPQLWEPFRAMGTRLGDWLSPASDASTDDKAYRIAMELPGVAEDDIDLTVNDGVVSVTGEKRTETEDKGETWFFSERQYGKFRRTFRLPADADAENVTADLKDGVLTVSVPKKAPAEAKARKVRIARA